MGEPDARRLTSGPGSDRCPAWSPDGKLIAFLRSIVSSENYSVFLVSPLGGSERRLVDFPVSTRPSWSPDGRWLSISRARAGGEDTPEAGGIYLLPAGGGVPRPVTFPKPPIYHQYPAFSPDGRSLAYSACENVAGSVEVCDVHAVQLDAQAQPHGPSRRLTHQGLWNDGLAWTRDGSTIVYGVFRGSASRLWRVSADGANPPEEVTLAGSGSEPFTAAGQDRLGFVRNMTDIDIHRLQLGSAQAPFLASTGWDFLPQYSPDGRRIVFNANRSGHKGEVFLADADGSNVMRLTNGPGRQQGAAVWSPDGRSIAFDSQAANGHFDIWTIEVDGSGLRQVTHNPADESVPSWSRDGRWIYFASNQTGRSEVWRVPDAGGAEEQVTRDGGYMAFESPDGRTLYFKRSNANSAPLVARSLGGTERTIIDCVNGFGFAVGSQGVLHLDCPRPTGDPTRRGLRLWISRPDRIGSLRPSKRGTG